MKSRLAVLSVALLGGLTSTLVSTGSAQSAAPATPPATLRLAVFPNVTHAAGLVGINRGLFQKELGRTKLVVTPLANGSQVSEAFAAGALDAAYVGPGPAMNAFLRGVPIQVIAGAANAGAVLVTRSDVKVIGVKNLDGRKVAVPTRGSTQDISLRHLLHENGLKATDEGGTVSVVPIDPANMPAAFASKQVDAALVQEPWGAYMQSKNGARLLVDQKGVWNGGDYTSTVLVVNTKYAAANPEAVKALLRGHLAAIRYIAGNNAGAQTAISNQIGEFTGTKPDSGVLFRALARTVITSGINLKTLAEYAQLNKEAGFARDVPDLSKFVDLSVLNGLQK